MAQICNLINCNYVINPQYTAKSDNQQYNIFVIFHAFYYINVGAKLIFNRNACNNAPQAKAQR